MAMPISLELQKVHPVDPEVVPATPIGPDASDLAGKTPEKDRENPDVPYTNTSLYKAMLPVFWSLRFCGLGYVSPRDKHITTQGKSALTFSSISGRVYSSVVLIVLCLNVGRTALVFTGGAAFGPQPLFGNIILFGWVTLCALNAMAMYRICHREHQYLRKFFLGLHELMLCTGHETGCLRYVNIRVLVTTVVSWMLVFVNMGFAAYLLFYTALMDTVLVPATPDFQHVTVVRVLYMILLLYLSAAWMIPTALLFNLCLVLYLSLSVFNSTFKRDNLRLLQLERYRTWHNRLSELVDVADDMFSLQVATALVIKVLLIILTLYNVIWYPDLNSDPLAILANAFWLTSGFAFLTILAVGGGMINHAVSIDHGTMSR